MGGLRRACRSVCRVVSRVAPITIAVTSLFVAATPVAAMAAVASVTIQAIKPKTVLGVKSQYVAIALNVVGGLSNVSAAKAAGTMTRAKAAIATQQITNRAALKVAEVAISEKNRKAGAAFGLGLGLADLIQGGIPSRNCVVQTISNVADNTSRVLILVNEEDAAEVFSALGQLGHNVDDLYKFGTSITGSDSFESTGEKPKPSISSTSAISAISFIFNNNFTSSHWNGVILS
jgi:hypothetical protein